MFFLGAIRQAEQRADALEGMVRSEISELFLLLKSGKLSKEEKGRMKARIDGLIAEIEAQRNEECCRGKNGKKEAI